MFQKYNEGELCDLSKWKFKSRMFVPRLGDFTCDEKLTSINSWLMLMRNVRKDSKKKVVALKVKYLLSTHDPKKKMDGIFNLKFCFGI